ncbi:MAG TPA: urate hydroxylase PuuD [Candidatus Paenalcaligenes intestinipullorum]|uniref:Urate hydroxylase PuuD n=1 Tax=Candidatus Paenalcaligenes intestinipullorum TaxID=2838718 RepID=A0A9D2RJY0_9BURK|nr:urate hydroxylase PuuD [Candidatus Paenalcaligenes intestinipullorum]
MDAYLLNVVTMLLRWLHVIAAIAWIGESIYFVMLDNGLRPPTDEEGKKKGVFGEMWAVHGGGFYHNQKFLTNPPKIPDDLHWSFWKSYTTWMSGFALFVFAYMFESQFTLVNHSANWEWARNLTGTTANLVALGFLLAGWVIYNSLCKIISPTMEKDGILSVAVAIMMIVFSFLAVEIFNSKAAFLLIGAVMATSMSANVFFWIIPGQRRMVADIKAGREPNPLDGKRGKQRSVHNTYFTLPVVFLMLSTHFPFLYPSTMDTFTKGLIIVLFIFAGALIRQYFVLMHAGFKKPGYPAAGVVLLLVAIWLAAPAKREAKPVATKPAAVASTDSTAATPKTDAPAITDGTPAPADTAEASNDALAAVHEVMHARCIQCHSASPTMMGVAPLGLIFDTDEEVISHAGEIKRAVSSGSMPLGNVTQMTDEEREIIANWSGTAN